MRNKGFTATTRQQSFLEFWFSCIPQKNVRSWVIHSDNSILKEMSALSWVSVTAVILPGAVLRCLEPHRRISAFPKPQSLSTLNISQHHDLGKQQKQIQHTILMSAVKKWIPHVGKRGEHCVWHSCLFLPLFLRPAKLCLYATTISEAVKQEESIQMMWSCMKEMRW